MANLKGGYQIKMPDNDAELVRLVTEEHDHAAFETLFKKYFHQIEKHIMARFKCCPADAKDSAQHAFIQLWEKGTSLRGESAMPLLCRYASNSRTNEWRRNARFVSLTPMPGERPLDVAEHKESPEPNLPKDKIAALPAALSKLNSTVQLVLNLRYGQEMSLEEIAARIGKDQSTASRQAVKGLKALRRSLHIFKPRETNHRRYHLRKIAFDACASADAAIGDAASALKKPARSVAIIGNREQKA